MHLAYIVGTYPQPSETFIAREVAGLRARGHRVELFSLFVPVSGPAEEVTYGWASAPARVLRKLAEPAANRALARRWGREFARRGCDAVLAHFGSRPSTVAMDAAGELPFFLSLHARDIYCEAERLEEKLQRAAAVVTCTRANMEFLHAQYPRQSAKIHLVYHGLPRAWLAAPAPARPRAAGEPLRVLAAGRLVEKKGFAVLLEAGALLAQRGVAFTLRILGDGPRQAALRASARRLGLTPRLTLAGWANAEELCAAYAWADVFCCPSMLAADGDRDGLPNVLIEAQSRGLPAVGSRFSGILEAISDGHTGFLVPPGDAIALAEALARYTDPTLRAAHGTAARSACQANFDGERWLERLVQILLNPRTAPNSVEFFRQD